MDAIGEFPAQAFEHSAITANDMSDHVFGCHDSGTNKPQTCAGFLLKGADHNLTVRLQLITGGLDLSQVSDGGNRLHPDYRTMAIANGVSPESSALKNCR